MTHSQGDVFAWDGVGDFELDGATYLGVRGLASISGVSDSGDLQNGDVAYTLNGVSLPLLNQIDPGVRGETITLKAAWVNEAGTALYTRTLRIDIADVLSMALDAETKSITIKARSPLAEWQTPPRAYYTDSDQQRRYPGDTGFKFVQTLENVNVAGWSSTVEATSGIPVRSSSGLFYLLRDHITLKLIGDNLYGMTAVNVTDASTDKLRTNSTHDVYKEETSGVEVGFDSSGFLAVSSVDTYIDASGDVRSVGGKLILIDALTTHRLRIHGAIAAIGAGSATTVDIQAGITAGGFTRTYARKNGVSISGDDMQALVYCNKNGRNAVVSGGTIKNEAGTAYVEETTGNAVTFTGGNIMQVSGANVTVSSTGAIRTNAGNFIVKQGSSFANGEFLRVWT